MSVEAKSPIKCAQEAFLVADFRPQDIDGEESIKVIPGPGGREGFLPANIFDLRMTTLKQMDMLLLDYAYHSESRYGNIQLEAVLKRLHGEFSNRILGYVAAESVFLARDHHRADFLVSTLKITHGIGYRNSTTYAQWDNGSAYESFLQMLATFTGESGFSPFIRKKPLDTRDQEIGRGSNLSEKIGLTAIHILGGNLTVLSGKSRLDMSAKPSGGYNFTLTPTRGIDGNLIIARMPHIGQ